MSQPLLSLIPLFALTLFAPPATAASLPGPPVDPKSPNPGLRVRLYLHVGVEAETLRRAVETASELLAGAAVTPTWTVCPVQQRSVACDGPFALREVTVQLLPLRQRSDAALGFAIIGPPGRLGRHARVFWDGVLSVAQRHGADRAALLGHVMAHEIGHLLLGENSHSRRGLMRADWKAADFESMRALRLRFNREQAAAIEQALAQPGG